MSILYIINSFNFHLQAMCFKTPGKPSPWWSGLFVSLHSKLKYLLETLVKQYHYALSDLLFSNICDPQF